MQKIIIFFNDFMFFTHPNFQLFCRSRNFHYDRRSSVWMISISDAQEAWRSTVMWTHQLIPRLLSAFWRLNPYSDGGWAYNILGKNPCNTFHSSCRSFYFSEFLATAQGVYFCDSNLLIKVIGKQFIHTKPPTISGILAIFPIADAIQLPQTSYSVLRKKFQTWQILRHDRCDLRVS